MKKVLVIIAILVAAAACGARGLTREGAAPLSLRPSRRPVGAPSKSTAHRCRHPTVNSAVPAIQGPQVIRQAQLTSASGAGTSTRSWRRFARWSAQQALSPVTDAQAAPRIPTNRSAAG